MSFIDELFESGGNFVIKRTDGGASLAPASGKDTDLESFQHTVQRVRQHAGDGYTIYLEHVASDRPGNLVDLLLLAVD